MEGKDDYKKKKKKFGNNFSEKKRVNKKIIFFNMIYLMILFIICFIGGVLLGLLTTSYTPEINIFQNSENTFYFLLKENKVIVGGKLNIKLNISNNTMLSYIYHSQNVKYFYYPIGASHRCLLYNGGLEETSANQAPLTHKSEISEPLDNNEETFPTKLSVRVKYSLLKPSTETHIVPLHLGYELSKEYMEEIQPLYDDCKRYNKIYFSIRLEELYITSEFRKVRNGKNHELMFSCKCDVDAKLDAFFTSTPVNKSIIFENLKNDPTLLE
ncbi:conserved Plasmodium protein, unknown function [Plasmodium ovale]|uniref:Uncharacterized protein n=1 Tax=Plasmodium ovale TaxID=36330 RepID=A0A1D3TGM2_PLAOA|nr:conserved Plasmodium protein, unknown function [Plasmodium ovale]